MPHSRTVSRRLVAGLCALAAGTAALAATAPQAHADVTQNASCVDGGGIRWSARAVWGQIYRGAGGITKATIDYAGWTTAARGTVPTDSQIRTYNGAGTLLQDLRWTGQMDYQGGTVYRSRNPVNPPSAPGKAKVKLTLGVDGDGFSGCTVTFTQPTTSTSSTSDRYEADVVSATNRERTSADLATLTPQACIDSYAEAQARRMAAESQMFHQAMEPILEACNLSRVGENVAYGYSSGAAVTAAWMTSPGHRANLLNSRFRLIGVGAAQDADGRWYASQVFGA